ncbi:MAG: YdcF family protein [archaeon]
MKYDAIIVLSGPDVETTDKRIKKAAELFYQGLSSRIIFSGFNTEEEHDSDFTGTDWFDDERLKNHQDLVVQGGEKVVYASDTYQNVEQIAELLENGCQRIAVVSSKTHIGDYFSPLQQKRNTGIVPAICHQLIPHYNSKIDFIHANEPEGKGLRRMLEYWVKSMATKFYELAGLKRARTSQERGEVLNVARKKHSNLEILLPI